MKEKLFEIERQLADLRHYVRKLRPKDFIDKDLLIPSVRLTKEHLHEINNKLCRIEQLLDKTLEESVQ
jgi:hypothetical protein